MREKITKIEHMGKIESNEEYELNTHADLYEKFNYANLKIERLMAGVGVFAFLICLFGGLIVGYLGNISDNSKILARIEENIKSIIYINKEFKEEIKKNSERILILEREAK